MNSYVCTRRPPPTTHTGSRQHGQSLRAVLRGMHALAHARVVMIIQNKQTVQDARQTARNVTDDGMVAQRLSGGVTVRALELRYYPDG